MQQQVGGISMLQLVPGAIKYGPRIFAKTRPASFMARAAAGRTVGDLLNDSSTKLVKQGTPKRAAIYERSGGPEQALEDFNSLNPSNIQPRPGGQITGELPNGTMMNLHLSSETIGHPTTLEIQTIIPKYIKIRYPE